MLPLYKQFLESRGVTSNTTWLRSDNSEMYVILPEDEEETRALCEEFACTYSGSTETDPQYLRILRIAVESNRQGACVDVAFVPWLCGLIDQDRIKRIG